MRDNNEQHTVPDSVDWDTYVAPDDPDQPNHRYVPRAVPDHGRQPRLPKRPTLVVYKRDPHNTYRPTSYIAPLHDASDNWRIKERQVARILADSIRQEAPRLAYYRESAIDEVIERRGIMSIARATASWLPPDGQNRVLDAFSIQLREEVARNRKNKNIAKI